MQRQTHHFADSGVRDKSLRTGHQWFFCESIQSACFWTSVKMGTHVISRSKVRASIATQMNVPFLDLRPQYLELKDQFDGACQRVAESGQFILGREVESFESEFAAYCGAGHCIGVGNGLDALHLIVRALDIGPGDEVLVPANTYIATWLAVSYAGATPVPIEPNERTYNIDFGRIEAAITKHTRAIIAVHLYGQPADMDPINKIASQYGLKVIEDT